MSTKHTKTFKAFETKHNLSYSNFFTFTNPKVLKNEKISEIPTAVLMLMNTPKACPAAGSCKEVCLITSGNPIYLDNKIKCRIRRNKAFMTDYSIFLRYLVVNCFRHYSKNRTAEKVAYRLNDNQLLKNSVQFYDYSKRIDRNFDKAKKLNYHLSLSHGSKYDTFSKSLELGLNYAAAFNLKKSQPLPTKFEYRGKVLTVIDGDITDARFTDINTETHIIGLRFKIVVNKDNAKKLDFCIA